MKLTVIGASGFVGRHVLADLGARGIDVVATATALDRRNRPQAPNIRWIALDIHHAPDNCFEMLGRPDAVIHLAWAGLPNYRSLHHFESELPAQYRFISALVRQGLASLITTGTCFEYGLRSGPLAASMQTRPANPYGLAKDTLHKQLRHLQGAHPFNLAWARLFYVFGDGQPATSLLPMLKAAVAAGQPAFNMSQGEQLRDYLPAAEVARQLVELALDPRDRGAINICSGVPVSVRRLVEGWIAENGWSIKLNLGHFPYPEYEPLAFWGEKLG